MDAFTGEPAEVMAALKTSLDSVAKAHQKSTDRLCAFATDTLWEEKRKNEVKKGDQKGNFEVFSL